VAKVGNIKITGFLCSGGRGSAELVEKVGTSNMVIVKLAIRLRCFRKHELKDHKGKEEEEGHHETANIPLSNGSRIMYLCSVFVKIWFCKILR
jgi:hypothetical protein